MQTMTTWKHRKKAAKRQKVFTIGLAVLIFLCGIVPGYWLGYKHSKVHQLTDELERTRVDLERTRVDLAKAKFELEKALKTSDIHTSKISDIHNNIETMLLRIFDVYSKHSKLVEVADKNMNKNKKEKAKRELKIMWDSEFSPLKEHLTQLENTLSELENREPRNFDLPELPSMILREIKN